MARFIINQAQNEKYAIHLDHLYSFKHWVLTVDHVTIVNFIGHLAK